MRAIWKFPIHATPAVAIKMPAGAEILSVQVQNGEPCVWAIVDPEALSETRMFRVIGTGWEVESFDGLKFTGTFQLQGGSLVFHLFEVEQ